MRFAAAAIPAPSGGSVGVGGLDPSPLSIEDLVLIYRIVDATEPGADPFENGEIQHLKKSLEEYLSRQPERYTSCCVSCQSQRRPVSTLICLLFRRILPETSMKLNYDGRHRCCYMKCHTTKFPQPVSRIFPVLVILLGR